MTAGSDILAIGAHPDDVELGVGGTLLLARERGERTVICHLTEGELGTRGTREIRRAEAAAAAEALGAAELEILDLGDGHLEANQAAKSVVIDLIRRHRPRLILAPYWDDLHPDHRAAGELVRQCAFLAGVAKRDPGLAPWRPERVLYFMQHTSFEPHLIVDVSPVFAEKKRAAMCYRSQFHDPDSREPRTYISGENFWDWWEGRARHWGHVVGVAHGEPLFAAGPIPTRDPLSLFGGFGRYRNEP
ncbi:MAG: bacillithiol biosynthesis deacetylase BshB1 [Planctomycetota bacterium]